MTEACCASHAPEKGYDLAVIGAGKGLKLAAQAFDKDVSKLSCCAASKHRLQCGVVVALSAAMGAACVGMTSCTTSGR